MDFAGKVSSRATQEHDEAFIAERKQKDNFWLINILIEGAGMDDALRGCVREAEDQASKERKGAKTTTTKI